MILISVSHENIIQYCDRPFQNSEEMDKFMIREWNNAVKKQDKVYHLGDFGWKNKKYIKEIVPQLNGMIYLIKGNHDTFSNQFYRDCGIKEVYDKPIIVNDFIIMQHEPPMFAPNFRWPYLFLYGHVHATEMYRTVTMRTACMCVERWGYKPILLNEIVKLCEEAEKAI